MVRWIGEISRLLWFPGEQDSVRDDVTQYTQSHNTHNHTHYTSVIIMHAISLQRGSGVL